MLLPAGLKIISDQSLALSLRPRRNIRRDLENKDCKVSALNFKSLGFSSLRSLRKPTTTSTNSSPTPTRQRCPRLGQGVVDERKEIRVWIDCGWEDSEPKPILLFSGSDLERKYHYLQWVWWSQRKETLWVDSHSSDLERTSMSRVCSVRPVDLGEFMEPPAGPVSSLKILWEMPQSFSGSLIRVWKRADRQPMTPGDHGCQVRQPQSNSHGPERRRPGVPGDVRRAMWSTGGH